MEKNVEILSPAGSYESLVAAIQAGADAVYIGGTKFGARAYANNLDEEKMLEAIDYVHLHGRKIYLTVNTLLKEDELSSELYEYLLPYYLHGIDAVIVQDIGVLQYIKRNFPDLPIHASTQMTVTNVKGAKFVEELGVERVVTSREMSLAEIKEISEQTSLEIESFVHGALCYCYSGQCLYSSLIGGRSGNRGQCAQPCRLPYRIKDHKENMYLMSLKDMCTLEYIPELIDAGIYSFKIEGRMKKPEYVALVTAMYRKYVDLYFLYGKENYRVDPKDREMLMDLYNRGGSHKGYYFVRNGRQMLSLDRPNHAGVKACELVRQNGKNLLLKALVDLNKGDVIEVGEEKNSYTISESVRKGSTFTMFISAKMNLEKGTILNRTRNNDLIARVNREFLDEKKYCPIDGKLVLREGFSAQLSLFYHSYSVTTQGEIVEKAVNQPLNLERIDKQMRKTGNTEFQFQNLEIVIDGNIFIPMQQLNELRRNAIHRLEMEIVSSYRRIPLKRVGFEFENRDEKKGNGLYVYVETTEQFDVSVLYSEVTRIYLDCNCQTEFWTNESFDCMIELAHKNKKEIFLAMPHIFRSHTIQLYEENYEKIFLKPWDGFLIRNIESFMFLREHQNKQPVITDHNLYQFNREAKKFWLEQGVESTTAPLELNYHELSKLGLESSEFVCYGYLPMMVSAQCIQKTTKGCTNEPGKLIFVDRYHKEFTVKNQCDYCYNVIYNTSPLVLTDQKTEIYKLSPKALRLHFTIENKEDTKRVLDLYKDVFVKNVGEQEPEFDFTRGHFKRGIK